MEWQMEHVLRKANAQSNQKEGFQDRINIHQQLGQEHYIKTNKQRITWKEQH